MMVPNGSSEPLKIVVYDKDKFLQDKFMGQVSMYQASRGVGRGRVEERREGEMEGGGRSEEGRVGRTEGSGEIGLWTVFVPHTKVEIEVADLQMGQRYKTWYRLQHQEPKQKEKK